MQSSLADYDEPMIPRSLILMLAVLAAGCGSTPTVPGKSAVAARQPGSPGRGEDVVLFALGLLQTNYRFGGKNPEAGFDCSGMVSYVFDRAAGLRLTGSAADIARKGRPAAMDELKPGDLVFFNTQNRPRSHVGIYIGDGRFVHAPSRRGEARVRTDNLSDAWYASRFEEARTYFD
jgi:cell wall-associated NlpC family hydrolase